MIIEVKNNNISFTNYDEKTSYNVKDIKVSIPDEPHVSSFSLYLDSEQFDLILGENNLYSIKLNEENFNGGNRLLKLKLDGVDTNELSINLNPYTSFSLIYNLFFDKITDDMYMELTKEDTYKMVKGIFLAALTFFEFPRVDIYNFDLDKEVYNIGLSLEEMDIIATYMVMHWIGQQLASVENTRMKYSGSDFKFTSQANHMAKLQNLKKEYERHGFHLQRLYKRRKADEHGIMRSTFGTIMDKR